MRGQQPILQYDLRAEDLGLKSVVKAKFIFRLDDTEGDFSRVADSVHSSAEKSTIWFRWWLGAHPRQRCSQASCTVKMLRARIHRPSDRSAGPPEGKTALDSKA